MLLPLAGRHNVKNALAAIATGLELGVPFETLAGGCADFAGVARRFQILGERDGVTVVDDYAHHPTELRAVLAAARQAMPGRPLVAVFQPHLYSRTRDFATGFAEALLAADAAIVVPIYPARERPIDGVDSGLVVAEADRLGDRSVTSVSGSGRGGGAPVRDRLAGAVVLDHGRRGCSPDRRMWLEGLDEAAPSSPTASAPTSRGGRRDARFSSSSLVPMTLVLVPLWRVRAVDVSGCAGLPAAVRSSIEELEGRPALMVSPQWVRRQLEVWPEVAAVEVRLELPKHPEGLRVTLGSPRIGDDRSGWHAVTESGAVGGRLDGPIFPVLEDIPVGPRKCGVPLPCPAASSRRPADRLKGSVA